MFLAASVGGHLELLESLLPAIGDRPRRWVTTEGARPRGLIDAGERVELLPSLDRGDLSLRRLLAGVRLALRTRPSVVVTSGAGVVAPFCLAARLLGARLIFVETMARVHHGSLTGRLLSRVADRVIIQWPELTRSYPDATVCVPLLLQAPPARSASPDTAGTFVSVGSHPTPFTRLLGAVSRALAADALPRPVLAQVGPGSLLDDGAQQRATLDPPSFEAAVRDHAVIVCHGGAGVIATALRHGRRPLVMARRSDLGEHVDDHQAQLVEKLASLGLIAVVHDEITPADVAWARAPRPAPPSGFDGLPSVTDEVAGWLAGVSR